MICYQLTMWRCNTRKIKKYNSASSYIFISGILFCILGQTPYPFCHAKRESGVLGGWVCQNKFIMMFCVTKWFQRKSHFKRKIKNYNVHTSVFHFITVLVLEGFLNSAFVISPEFFAPTSHSSSQNVEKGKAKNHVIGV